MDKYIGKRLDGRYEIKEIIGVGGMAYVYKAYDNIDDRVVAVKILKEEFLANEEFTRRFKNESKAIAILSHPNIVRVYDVSFGEKLQYIVMEYIDGITLKEYIDQKKVIPWKETVHFTVQVLRALQHAHDKGIIHRDIKPQNIMLTSDGTIKVTDFGIAQFSRNEIRTDGERAIGSVHYISPEQASGGITDEKADIYSLGVMLYEMLTGKLPFEADNAVSVAIMQMQSTPAMPREINESIPEGLEEITMKAMQKDPSKRYQSAAEMLYDIDEFKRNPSIHFEYKYVFVDETPTRFVETIAKVREKEKTVETEEELISALRGMYRGGHQEFYLILSETLANSCNPAFVELGLRLGTGTFYDYLEAFGLGRPTGVDIPGEASGILISRASVKRVDIARIGFGQSVAVTPIQLICAASAAVNGGNLMRPFVVKEILDAQGNVIEQGKTEIVSRPISENTSATMRRLLENVVTNGGGKNAYAEGYRIGGKTGTAQIYVDGVVSRETHIGSFIGFAPMDDPQIAVLFIVDEATQRPDYGSVTAAPYARDVLTQSLRYLGYAPALDEERATMLASVPNVTGMTVANAVGTLREAGFGFLLDGTGTRVLEQMPAGGAEMAKNSLVTLYVTEENVKNDSEETTVPEVMGMSVSEANRMLISSGLQMVIEGSGIAVSQEPKSGETVPADTMVRVRFKAPE